MENIENSVQRVNFEALDLDEHIIQDFGWYYDSDIWRLSEYPGNTRFSSSRRIIDFQVFKSETLISELKKFIYNRLTSEKASVSTVWSTYSPALRDLGEFIKNNFPGLSSILDVPIEKFLPQFRLYVSSLNLKENSTCYEARITIYNMLYEFISNLNDNRSEIERDRWDVRRLGIDFNKTSAQYHMDFRRIGLSFRELVKTYFCQRVVIQQSLGWSTACGSLTVLNSFFIYIAQYHPSWVNLNELKRTQVIGFIKFIRETPMGFGGNVGRNAGKPTSENQINYSLNTLEVFIQYIQRHEFEVAPRIHVKKLILPSDKPKQRKTKPENVKYIPDHIWNQVIDNLHQLPSEIVPVIVLMEATGFRGCDILLLKLNCLLDQEDGYWISGDQRKVNEQYHKVPISEEIANLVKAQMDYISENMQESENPDDYLFPIFSGKKKGQPFLRTTISYHLNKMAHNCNIMGESGEIYKFNNHAFRHRYGVTLINNGMSILHVQKLMAHLSPEMTLVYAKIHDRTVRKEWERVKNLGAVRLDTNGKVIEADIIQQAEENKLELEWIRHNLDSIRLDHGFCIKSPKINCSFLNDNIEAPCIKNKCPSLHVDQTFLPYYQQHIEKIEKDIEIYTRTGRIRSVEVIQPKLRAYKEIAAALTSSDGIMGMPKSNREYTEVERKQVEL
ncbi:tyrosine-type recombinase/integrase [Paenibacillus sp. 2RAB27]|uniref:tyrosine-type recombinase/integrase n=1 Tax=Paenibacillus sp. 2RAB27 TaxID=3232991 RepID=UPI003F9482E9